jgi:hypothetical protein
MHEWRHVAQYKRCKKEPPQGTIFVNLFLRRIQSIYAYV